MRLYIDPGTGSMLFTIMIGIIGAGIYSVRMLLIKLRFKLSGGKIETNIRKIPFVIFSDDKRYWTVFEPICREMDRRGRDVVYMTASEDDPALNNPYKHIHAEFIGKDNSGHVFVLPQVASHCDNGTFDSQHRFSRYVWAEHGEHCKFCWRSYRPDFKSGRQQSHIYS